MSSCPECNGYAKCDYMCSKKEVHDIKCRYDNIGSGLSRLVELFSGARVLPAIDTLHATRGGWGVLAHKSNRGGPSYYNETPVNVADATMRFVRLEEVDGLYVEDLSSPTPRYGDRCALLFHVGSLVYLLSFTSTVNGRMVEVDYSVPLKDLVSTDTVTVYREGEDWSSYKGAIEYGQRCFMQVGDMVSSVMNIITTSTCTADLAYKKLALVPYDTLAGSETLGYSNKYFAPYNNYYPRNVIGSPETVNVKKFASCDDLSYSVWFVPQSSDTGCAIPTASLNSGYNWILLFIFSTFGILTLILLIIGIMSIVSFRKGNIRIDNRLLSDTV